MTSETKPQKVTIDLDEIWEPAVMGVCAEARSSVLGTNATKDPSLTDFDLPGLLKLSYSRSTPNIEEIKVEFEAWVLANAFREAVESFARVALHYKEEECRFALGARLLLEPSDVKHTFWTLNQCGLELKSSIIAKLQQMGVPFKSLDASIDRPVAAH